MTDHEKIIDLANRYKVSNMRELLQLYVDKYYGDLQAIDILLMIEDLNDFLHHKVISDGNVRYVAKERATYLKQYLKGEMYISREVAEQAVGVQIKNAEAIIDACNGKIN